MFLNKYNYLLLNAVIFGCIYFFLYFFFNAEINENQSLKNNNDFMLVLLSAIFIAPLLEELTFRGFFVKSIILKILSPILLIVFILNKNLSYFSLALPLIILWLIYLSLKKEIRYLTFLVYFLNTLIFGLIHYKVDDLTNILIVYPIFIQMGFGFLLLWITLNFNIIKSIITHSLINILLLSPIVYQLQFPNTSLETVYVNNYIIKFNKESLFSLKPKRIKYNNESGYLISNMTPKDMYSTFAGNHKHNFNNVNDFYKFTIQIKKNRGGNQVLSEKDLKNLLVKINLLE